ncbi:hypothetical protein SprV_0602181200 [Sparganum proliferum]
MESRPSSSKRQHSNKPVPVSPPSSSSSNNQPGSLNFANLNRFFEPSVLRAARRWEKFALRISSTRAQLHFLHRCLDNQLTPKSVTYKPPVNSSLARETVARLSRRMTRVLINDCHQRLERYNLEIEQSKCHLWTAVGEESKDIELTILRHAQKVRVKRDKELSTKLEKLRVPNPDNSSGVLVHNLSSKPLTDTQLAVLERGATFNTADAAPTEFIAAFESVLQLTRASEETKDLIRHQTSSLLMRHKRCETLSNVEQRALKSLKANKDIIILPADKGRSTVVLDKSDYQNKVQDLLEDQHSYKQCRASEMKNLITRINKSLRNLRAKGAITPNDWFSMKPTDTATARFYGLPKFLAEGSPTTVTSANQFLERIKHLKLEPDESMVSFDVVSLFTSIPQQLAIDVVDQLLAERYEERDKPLKSEHLLELLRYCLKTYFTFGGQMYEQIKGTPMGSPLSGLIAEVVLQRIEHLVFAKYQPKFWARYVDDTFVVVKTADIEHLKELLNSVDPDIQFTMEAETNNQLPFLDVLVRRCTTGQLQTAVFRKSTDTRQTLHFNSNHPLSHKRSCVRTLFQRVETHCSTPEDKRAERMYLQNLFAANGYPRHFIERSRRRAHRRRPNEQQPEVWRAIPYVKGVSEAVSRLLQPARVGIAHRPQATIRRRLMQPKDPLSPAETSAVIYKINCKEGDCNYVGETGRKLQTRLQEHKSATRRLDPNSQLATHIGETGHTFDLQRATILGRGNTKAERLTLEAWFSDAHSINRHLDLPAAYKVLRHHNRRAQDQTTTPGLMRPHGDSPTASLPSAEEQEPPGRPPDTGSVTSPPAEW